MHFYTHHICRINNYLLTLGAHRLFIEYDDQIYKIADERYIILQLIILLFSVNTKQRRARHGVYLVRLVCALCVCVNCFCTQRAAHVRISNYVTIIYNKYNFFPTNVDEQFNV